MSTMHYNMEDPLIKEYMEKLNALVRGELIVNNEEGLKLMVEGSLNLERFLDCYVNTRKDIKYELLSRAMSELPNEACSKSDLVKLLKTMIEEEPKQIESN